MTASRRCKVAVTCDLRQMRRHVGEADQPNSSQSGPLVRCSLSEPNVIGALERGARRRSSQIEILQPKSTNIFEIQRGILSSTFHHVVSSSSPSSQVAQEGNETIRPSITCRHVFKRTGAVVPTAPTI